jgi:hypothetical protein
MTRTLLATTLASLSILTAGCGTAALPRGAEAPEAEARAALADAKGSSDGSAYDDDGLEDASGDATAALARAPGDFIVYRFSGSFRKAPLTLTQKVFAREGMTLVIDMTLEGKDRKTELRVRMNDSAAARGEVLSVARLENGAEKDAGIAAYEALMAEVALAADQNEELLGTEEVSVEVGGATLACKRTSFRVKLGKQKATMSTLEKDGFAWGDLGGEIVAKDGTVLYRAEVVQIGDAATTSASAIAHTDADE